ncbi:MAG: hypothetical protein ABJP45_15970 [Cyclobacteriaceae bacterium]
MSEFERLCLECKRPVSGRSDKKFCSDGCRNAYNNKSNAPATNYVRNVNNTLGRNRRILVKLNSEGNNETHRDQLLKNGFDFDFYTHSLTTKTGEQYLFCYEQGYRQLLDGTVILVVGDQNFER